MHFVCNLFSCKKNTIEARNTAISENPTFGRSERTQAWPLWLGLDALGSLAGGIGSLASGGSLGQAGTQALIWGAAGSVPGTRWFRNLFR